MRNKRKSKVLVSVLIASLLFAMVFGAGVFANDSEWKGQGLGGFKMHGAGTGGPGSDGHDKDEHSHDEPEVDGETSASSDEVSGATVTKDVLDGNLEEEHDSENQKGGSTGGAAGNWGGGSSQSEHGGNSGTDTHGKPIGHEPGEEEETPDPFDDSIPETETLDEGKFVTLNIKAIDLAEGDEAEVCVYKLDDGLFTYKNLITIEGGIDSPYAVSVPVGHQCFVESAPVPGYLTPAKQTVSLGEFKGNFAESVELVYKAKEIEVEEFKLSFEADSEFPVTEAMLLVGEEIEIYPLVNPMNARYDTIAWLSSDETVATVEEGVVTAVAPGDVTISARLKWEETILREAAVSVAVKEISTTMGPVIDRFEYETGQRYSLPMSVDIEIDGLIRTLQVTWPSEWSGAYVQHLDDGDYLYFTEQTASGKSLPLDAKIELYGRVNHEVTVSGSHLNVFDRPAADSIAMVVNQGDLFELSYELPDLGQNLSWQNTDLTGFYFTSTNPDVVEVSNLNRTLAELTVEQQQVVSSCIPHATGFVYVYLRNSQGAELASWGISVVKAAIDLVDNAYIMGTSEFLGEDGEEHFDEASNVFITCKNLFDVDQLEAFKNTRFYIRVTEKGTEGLLGEGSFKFDQIVWFDGEVWRYLDTKSTIEEFGKRGAIHALQSGVLKLDELDKTIAGFHLTDVVELKPNTNSSKEVFVELSTDNMFPDGDEGERPKTYHTNFKIGSAVPTGSIEVDILNPNYIPIEELVGRHAVLTREEFPEGTTLGSVSIYDFYQDNVPTYPDGRLTPHAESLDIYTELYVDEVKLFGRIATRASVDGSDVEFYIEWEEPREIPLKIGGYFLLIDYLPYKTDLEKYDDSLESMLKEVHLKKSGDLVKKTVTFFK